MATRAVQFVFTVSPQVPVCRCPDRGCPVPAGWDAAHSDSERPYTVEELQQRREPPHGGAYASAGEYLQGWRLWRAYRRDERLNDAEGAAKRAVVEAEIRRQAAAVSAQFT